MNKLSTLIASFTFETVYIALVISCTLHKDIPDIFFGIVCTQIALACSVYIFECLWYKQELKPYLPKWLILHNFICCLPIFIGGVIFLLAIIVCSAIPNH